MKKQISERLVMARINQSFAKQAREHPRLCKCRRTDPLFTRCGTYWVQGINGEVVRDHIDLEKTGRELGVIAEWETMVKAAADPCYNGD